MTSESHTSFTSGDMSHGKTARKTRRSVNKLRCNFMISTINWTRVPKLSLGTRYGIGIMGKAGSQNNSNLIKIVREKKPRYRLRLRLIQEPPGSLIRNIYIPNVCKLHCNGGNNENVKLIQSVKKGKQRLESSNFSFLMIAIFNKFCFWKELVLLEEYFETFKYLDI